MNINGEPSRVLKLRAYKTAKAVWGGDKGKALNFANAVVDEAIKQDPNLTPQP